MKTRRWIVGGLLFCAIIITLIMYPFKKPDSYLQQDEFNYSEVGIFAFQAMFIDHQFYHPNWRKPLNTFGCVKPPVGKYIIGASLWLHGYRTYNGPIRIVGEYKTVSEFFASGVYPADKLAAARKPTAFFAGLAFLFLGLIALRLAESLTATPWIQAACAFLAPILMITNRAVWVSGHRAMGDMIALCFSIIGFYFFLLTLDQLLRDRFRKAIAWSIITAILIGLAVATKMNALLVYAAIIAASVLSIVVLTWNRWMTLRRFMWQGLSAGIQLVVPWLIFVITNPFLYQHTLRNVRRMVDFGKRERGSGLPQRALDTVGKKLYAVTKHGFNHILGDHPVITGLLVVLLIVGGTLLCCLVVRKIMERRQVNMFTAFAVLGWTAATVLGTLWWSELPWSRYYVPVAPGIAILLTVGILWIASRVMHKQPWQFENL